MKSIVKHQKTTMIVVAVLISLNIISLHCLSQNLGKPVTSITSDLNVTSKVNPPTINTAKYKPSNTGFVKNAGQVYDYDKKPVTSVLYSLNAENSSIFITNTGLTYSLIERDSPGTSNRFENLENVKSENKCLDKNVARLDIELIGAELLKENIIEQYLSNDVKISYYGSTITPDAINLNYCKQLIIKNIYPQIDWVLKITENEKFKYDFIVHPGADANLIQLKYNGAIALRLNTAKDKITATTALGKITEGKLYCYMQNDERKINATYSLVNDTVKISIPGYNKNQTLIIDPEIEMALTWSTFYGGGSINGGGGTMCTAIKCDESHNRAYIAGYCFSNPFPNYNNSVAYFFSPAQAGSTIEAFISAFDLNGKQLWATYYMSTEYDGAFDVTTDLGGNVYITGTTESHTSSSIGFLTQQYGNGYIQPANNAIPTMYGVYYYQEGFIVKFNSSGQLKWATLFGGDHTDQLYSITCDNNNNVYVAGLTWSQNALPLKKQGANGYFRGALKNGQTGIIAAFSSTTELTWSTYFGSVAQGGGSDCRTINCDGHNNVYVTGAVGLAGGFPFKNLPGAYYNPGDGYYLATFDGFSKLNYCSSFQASQTINALGINETDGTVLIAGSTDSNATFTWINTLNNNLSTYFDDTYNGGDHDGFMVLLNPDFSIAWSTLLGGNGNDVITAAGFNKDGELFTTGYSDNSTNAAVATFPVVNPGGSSYFQNNSGPFTPSQIFISAFKPKSGIDPFQLSWSTLFGDENSGREFANDFALAGNAVFITGNAFLEPQAPGFPLVCEPNGFLQTANAPLVNGFNPSGSNGLILKFKNELHNKLKTENTAAIESDLKLFPNPCADKFIFLNTSNSELSNALIKVVDASGRCVKLFHEQFTPGENVSIAINDLAKGYYFLSVQNAFIERKIPFVKR